MNIHSTIWVYSIFGLSDRWRRSLRNALRRRERCHPDSWTQRISYLGSLGTFRTGQLAPWSGSALHPGSPQCIGISLFSLFVRQALHLTNQSKILKHLPDSTCLRKFCAFFYRQVCTHSTWDWTWNPHHQTHLWSFVMADLTLSLSITHTRKWASLSSPAFVIQAFVPAN